MKQKQIIEIVCEVKKATEIKQGKSEYASCGVTVYTGKDKQTGQHKSQWYSVIAIGTDKINRINELGFKGNILRIIGSVDFRAALNKENKPTVFGTIFPTAIELVEKTQTSSYTQKSTTLDEDYFI